MNCSLESLTKKNNNLDSEIKALEKKSFYFSLFRLFSFIASVVLLILAFVFNDYNLFFLVSSALIFIGFVILCIVHFRLNSDLKFKRVVRDINLEYIARVTGDFSKLNDKGTEFIVPEHDYCIDLDVFGDNSLFSLLNVSESAFGRKKLSDELLYAHTSGRTNEELSEIQESVHELSEDIDFLQEYQALARLGKLKKMPSALLSLSDDTNSFFTDKMRYLTRGVLLLWIVPLVIFFLIPRLFTASILFIVFINLIVSFSLSSRYVAFFKAVDGISRQCNAIYKLYLKLESKQFKTNRIKVLINGDNDLQKQSIGLYELSKICNKCAYRAQPLLALVLNAFCLYDSICADKLNSWIQKYGKDISKNIDNLATIESMMSASVVEIVFSESSKPVFVDADRDNEANAFVDGVDMLHPLLKRDTAVSNSIKLDSEIAIITGSNMSGKTTLIRTVGTMAILSYIGSNVPAKSFKIGRMRIISSMRIVDSIKEEMSTFKAELVRIASIVNAGRENKPMLFLIDEIFRGTNSADRTSGAMEVLRNLSRPMIIGFMTTHDYALCDQAKDEMKNIAYYHFSETYDDSGISFDYKLKNGMTKISNAKQLMKLVGIIL